MHEIVTKCDACGKVITGNSNHLRIRDPHRVQQWWSMLGHWVELDICPTCYRGLKEIAESLILVKQARGN